MNLAIPPYRASTNQKQTPNKTKQDLIMRLHIVGQIRLPYIKPHQKRINKLVNHKTTVANDICELLMDKPIQSLQGTYLDAVYSTPTNIKNPKLSDVVGVHLIDQSGLIVAEKKTIAFTSIGAIYDTVDKMIVDLPRKGFKVIVESVRDGVNVRNDTQVNATHAMEAITVAILTLASDVYDDLPSDGYKTSIIDSIQRSIMSLSDIVVTLDNGNTYKLLAVADHKRFEVEFSNVVVPRKA